MEYNIEEIVGKILESSSAKIVIRAPVKDEKELLKMKKNGKIGFRIFN
jgi:hypothetical protein